MINEGIFEEPFFPSGAYVCIEEGLSQQKKEKRLGRDIPDVTCLLGEISVLSAKERNVAVGEI